MNITDMQAVVNRMSLRDYPVEGANVVLGIEPCREGWVTITGKVSTDGGCWSLSLPAPNSESDLIRVVMAALGLTALMTVETRLQLDGQQACVASGIRLAVPFGQMLSILPCWPRKDAAKMIGAARRFNEIMTDLLLRREQAGGTLPQQDESNTAAELDRLWQAMSEDEHASTEALFARNPGAPHELGLSDVKDARGKVPRTAGNEAS